MTLEEYRLFRARWLRENETPEVRAYWLAITSRTGEPSR
jgi:hypothetical protein